MLAKRLGATLMSACFATASLRSCFGRNSLCQASRLWRGCSVRCSRPLGHGFGIRSPMYRSLLSVGGFTLLSRATGFMRDIVMAAVMGSGPLSDAFFIAFRLPNHFRTIFAEGAYNAAFVPLYTSLRSSGGDTARVFARNMLGWQIAIQLVLLAMAFVAMPWIVTIACAGHRGPAGAVGARGRADADYVFLSVVRDGRDASGRHVERGGELLGGGGRARSAQYRHGACARRDVFLSECGHAAAWGVFAGGIAEVVLLVVAARLGKFPVLPLLPKLTGDVRPVLRALRTGDVGGRGCAACDVRGHDPRQLSGDRRLHVALLCRPGKSVADGRHRHRAWAPFCCPKSRARSPRAKPRKRGIRSIARRKSACC